MAFDLKEVSAKDQDGVNIRDINYAAYNPAHKRIDAYLVRPQGRGRCRSASEYMVMVRVSLPN